MPRRSGLFLSLIALLSATMVILGAAGLVNGLRYSLAGERATGRVIEFHRQGAHTASVVAQVEVVAPGATPFRDEVDDAFNTQEWAVGGAVPLRCIHSKSWSCQVDSVLDSYLPPVAVLAVGAWLFGWSVRGIRDRKSLPTAALADTQFQRGRRNKADTAPRTQSANPSAQVPVPLRVLGELLLSYLANVQTFMAAFVMGAAGVFLILAWQWSGLEYRGRYKTFTARAQGRIIESWLALDFDVTRIRNPKNWPFSSKAERCVVVEYGESWGAPLRRAFCGNQFSFESYTTSWPDLGDLSRGVPFVWQRDARGFSVPEVRMDAIAYDWLNKQPPDDTTPVQSPSKTALESVRLSKDLPVEAAALGWSTAAAILPVSYDPRRPEDALPSAVVEARGRTALHILALIPGAMGLCTWFAGLTILPLTARLPPWLRWALAAGTLLTLPLWPQYLPRALSVFDAQVATLIGEIIGETDRTGRLVASAPEDAAHANGRRLTWRLEDSAYADPLARFSFGPPNTPFPNADAALSALTEAVSSQVHAFDAAARVELFARLRRLHRDGYKDAKGLFLPAAKAAAADTRSDPNARLAADQFLSDVQ